MTTKKSAPKGEKTDKKKASKAVAETAKQTTRVGAKTTKRSTKAKATSSIVLEKEAETATQVATLTATFMPEISETPVIATANGVSPTVAKTQEASAKPIVEIAVRKAPPAHTLTVGMFQQALQAAGTYQGAINGIYEPHTRLAAIAFQRANGLPPNGEPTPDTLLALGFEEK